MDGDSSGQKPALVFSEVVTTSLDPDPSQNEDPAKMNVDSSDNVVLARIQREMTELKEQDQDIQTPSVEESPISLGLDPLSQKLSHPKGISDENLLVPTREHTGVDSLSDHGGGSFGGLEVNPLEPSGNSSRVPTPAQDRCSSTTSSVDEIVTSAIKSAAADCLGQLHSDDALEGKVLESSTTVEQTVLVVEGGLKDEVEKLKKELEAAHATVREKEQQILVLADINGQSLTSLQQTITEKDTLIEQLRNALDRRPSSVEELQEEIQSLKAQIEELKPYQIKVEELKRQRAEEEAVSSALIEQLQSEKAQLENTVQGVGNDDLIHAIERLEQEVKERQSQIEVGTVMYKGIQEELETTKKKLVQYEEELSSVTKQEAPLMEKIRNLEESLAALIEEKATLSTNCQELEAHIVILTTELEVSKKKVDDLDASQYKSQIDVLESDKEALTEKMSKGVLMYNAALRTIEEGMVREQKLKEELEGMKSQQGASDENLKDELEAKDSKITQSMEIVENLKEELETLKSKQSFSEEDMAAVQEQILVQSAELVSSKMTENGLRNELLAVRGECAMKEEEIQKLKEDTEAKAKLISDGLTREDQLKSEMEEAQNAGVSSEEMTSLRAELQYKQEKLACAETDSIELKSQLEELRVKFDETSTALSDAKQELDQGKDQLGVLKEVYDAGLQTLQEAVAKEEKLQEEVKTVTEQLEKQTTEVQARDQKITAMLDEIDTYKEKLKVAEETVLKIGEEAAGKSTANDQSEQISTLEQEKKSLEDKIEKGVEMYNALVEEVQKSDENEKVYQSTIATYETQLKQIKTDLSTYEDKIDLLTKERDQFKEKAETTEKEGAEQEVAEFETQIAALEKEKQSLVEEMDKGKAMYAEAMGKIEEWVKKGEEYQANIAMYETQLEEIKKEMVLQDDKISLNVKEKEIFEAQILELKSKVEVEVEVEAKPSNTDNTEQLEQISKLQLENDHLTSEISNYKEQLKELRQKVDVTVTVTAGEETAAAPTGETETLTIKIAELEKLRDEREAKFESDITAYQGQIEKDTIAILALEERLDLMVKKTKEMQEEMARLRQGAGSPTPPPAPKVILQQPIEGNAETLIPQLRGQVSSLQSELTDLRAAYTAMEKDLMGAKARLTDVAGEMNEKQKEELETAKSQLQGKTQEVTQLQSQMAKLSNIVDQYKSEMETLKKNVNSKEKSSGKYKNIINDKDKKIKDLEEQVKKMAKVEGQMKKDLKAKDDEGKITTELTAQGAQCRGERHEETITRQREALGEVRQRIKMLEQNRPPIPGHDQALQQIVLLKRDLAELRAGQALAEHKKVLNHTTPFQVRTGPPPPLPGDLVDGSRSISMDEAKEHIFPVIENKHKLSNTLRDANANKSRTMASPPLAPANAWGEKSESTSRPNSGDNIPQGIADGKMFAPKPPEKPKGTRQLSPKGQFSPRDRPASSSTYLTEGREDGVTNGWHEQLGKASRAEADMERSAHIETNRSLELSEETYLTLLRGVASCLEMDSVEGLRSMAHLPTDERQRLATERERACAMLTNRINALKSRVARKDDLLNGYEQDLGKLRRAENIAKDRKRHVDTLATELRQKTEEMQYVRESLERTRKTLEQEKRLNSAIKQKKTFHLENEKDTTSKNKHSCVGKDTKNKLTAKQKEHREQIRKKNYELKVLKKELEARDNDLADTKRTLNIMKDVQSNDLVPVSQSPPVAGDPSTESPAEHPLEQPVVT